MDSRVMSASLMLRMIKWSIAAKIMMITTMAMVAILAATMAQDPRAYGLTKTPGSRCMGTVSKVSNWAQ